MTARLFPASALAAVLLTLPAAADTTASASYVVNLGGTIIATAKFDFVDGGRRQLRPERSNANVSGLAQLVASGTAKASSVGATTADGLRSNSFDLTTHSGGEDFSDTVQYQNGDVTAFIIDPPIVNNIDRVPIERSQLSGVNDMLAAFILQGTKLDKSLCDQHDHIFTGIERFDLSFSYAKDDVATSPRTGYQGPVVLCHVNYKPISGHYTTSRADQLAGPERPHPHLVRAASRYRVLHPLSRAAHHLDGRSEHGADRAQLKGAAVSFRHRASGTLLPDAARQLESAAPPWHPMSMSGQRFVQVAYRGWAVPSAKTFTNSRARPSFTKRRIGRTRINESKL